MNDLVAEHVTAKEIWVIVCMFFVFLAIVEYGIILLTQKTKTKRKLCPILKAIPKVCKCQGLR